ncbi:MAG TPA: LamG domain-containing protein [Pirellulales bacterium]|jgi:hypothetical protein|nr:LamG domain-containing protein [Pirellulales bacterium]
MTDPTRREFLLSTGSAIATGAMLGHFDAAALALDTAGASDPAARAAAIPPHRALPIQGVHLYTDKPSYAAGETLTAFVSNTLPCQLEVVRLGEVIDAPAKDEVLHRMRIEQPAMQPVHPGSYIHVEQGLPSRPVAALTLECWVRLWNVHEPQAIVSQLDGGQGFGLLVFPDGTLGLFAGEAADPAATTHRTSARLTLPGKPTFSSYVTPPADWHHVVAVAGGSEKTLWLDGRRVGQWPVQKPLVPAACPLRIGALGIEGNAAGLLDADIAMPVIYGRALNELEIRTRHAERGLMTPSVDQDLWGCWPLSEERGAALADISPAGRQGRIINHATWMIGGPSFMPVIARYRRDYEPRRDATRGHGLRLASDDLYDCHWQPTLTFTLPKQAQSGLYALRGQFTQAGTDAMTHATFVVRRAPETAPAPIALLFSTNTWKAYSTAPLGPAWPGVHGYINTNGYKPQRDDPLAAYCFYRAHRAGQPTYQLGWRMPWPASSPFALYSPPEMGYSHLSRADRFTQRWLEQGGYRYDALSDQDLHADPQALDGAKVLFIVGHSEYWTREAMQRVREFLDRGGNVVCLSGNTMYWRVTQNDDGAIIECRKADAWGAQLAEYMRGECWHEHDQRRGGVPRDCGDPQWQTLGVEFAGASGISPKMSGAFHVADAAHPFFHQPHDTGLKAGERFAFDRAQPSRQPIIHETDVRVSTLLEFTRRLPAIAGLATDLADPAGIRLLAVGKLASDGTLGAVRDYAHRVLSPSLRRKDDSLCDMIHWQRREGGQVFAAPSIGAGWTLAVCPQWSTLLKNVLHHFGVSSESTGV